MKAHLKKSMVDSSQSSVMAAVTLGLEEFIDHQGGDSVAVLCKSKLQKQSYRQPNQHISLNQYIDTIHESAKSTGNENFGLWFGHQFQPESLGLFGFYAITSDNLLGSIKSMEEIFPVFQRNSLLRLSKKNNVCQLEYRLLDGDIGDRRQDAELTLAMFKNIFARALGDNWSPLSVEFQHCALTTTNQHRDAFNCEVQFKRQKNCIRFRESSLGQPMTSADPMLHTVLAGVMAEQLSAPKQPLSWSRRIKSEIIDQLSNGQVDVLPICHTLHLSQRSLQRRLKEEQTSFKQLLDEVRLDQAMHYLSYDRLTISEIAYRLGYSEVSVFTRAFLRWKGINPSQWRERAQR